MPTLHYFAAADDIREVLDFVFAETDCRLYEAYSANDRQMREFRSTAEVAETFQLGLDPHGNGSAQYLALWSPSAVSRVTVKRIEFEPRYAKRTGATHRFNVDGPALIYLHFGGEHEGAITTSWLSCNSERRATVWASSFDPSIRVDWPAVRKLLGRLRYLIDRKLVAARVPGHAVLPHALARHRDGLGLKHGALSFSVPVGQTEET